MFKRWKYRVRDCHKRMIGHYNSLEEVLDLFQIEPWLVQLLREGESIAYTQDGIRYKIDVRGAYYDNTWSH